MNKTLENFLAQSKENHLKRIGLITNADEEYNALCLQIEQKDNECKEIRYKYDELMSVLFKLQTKSVFPEFRSEDNKVIIDYLHNLLIIDTPSLKSTEKDLLMEQQYIVHRNRTDEWLKSNKLTPLDLKMVTDEYEYIERLKKDVEDKKEFMGNRAQRISDAKNQNRKIKDKFISLIKEGLQIAQKEIEEAEDLGDGLLGVVTSDTSMLSRDIFSLLKDYKTTDWEQYYKLESDIHRLSYEQRKYKFEHGHWFLPNMEKKAIDLSDEEYDKICKIYPPFLLKIEEYIQDVYEKGYKKGNDDGYSAGYHQGYDDGYYAAPSY